MSKPLDIIEEVKKIKQSIKDTLPDKSDEGEIDFFILYPTIKNIVDICNNIISQDIDCPTNIKAEQRNVN